MSEQTDEPDITTREGAVKILRHMRSQTAKVMLSDPPMDGEEQLEEVFAQLYGITVILSVMLGDEDLKTEVEGFEARIEDALEEAVAAAQKALSGESPQ